MFVGECFNHRGTIICHVTLVKDDILYIKGLSPTHHVIGEVGLVVTLSLRDVYALKKL